jgi:hypothetical protein
LAADVEIEALRDEVVERQRGRRVVLIKVDLSQVDEGAVLGDLQDGRQRRIGVEGVDAGVSVGRFYLTARGDELRMRLFYEQIKVQRTWI